MPPPRALQGSQPPHGPPLGATGPPGVDRPVAAPGATLHGSDYALENPARYRAFEQMAVHAGDGGTKIGLPNGMCQNRHVEDFLMCLRCWLLRTFGDPQVTKRPWRLQCLDLSSNSLVDPSVCRVMDCLKQVDVRVERLWLAGNRIRHDGVVAITGYIWNCPDALVEVDLTDNEIMADPRAGPTPGSDVVSALLRCFYNHGAYPMTVNHGREGMKVLPMLLRVGGNAIAHPEKLLKQIKSKGGKEHVRVCSSAELYSHSGTEYLSVCLPDFLNQRITENGQNGAFPHEAETAGAEQGPPAHPGERRKRSRSEKRDLKRRRREHGEGRRRRRTTDGDREPDGPLMNAGGCDHSATTVVQDEPEAQAADSPERVATISKHDHHSSRSASSDTGRDTGRDAGRSTGLVEGQVIAQQEGSTQRAPPNEEEQKCLQQDVDERLKAMGGFPSKQSTREMLAEFVVCMVVARKGMSEIRTELETFLGQHTDAFMDWFQDHFSGTGRQ